ncbi:guanylate kinase [Flavobacteriales bacterium]|nr:guanylate kinase [Flavobacteriales bacterium]
MEGKSIVISAPSGAGKTSIVNFILAKINSIEFSISSCNRKQRPAEVNGKNYHFLSTSDFKEKIDKGFFLEWEEVYPDQFYGTSFYSVTTIWERGKHVIFDVDVKGGLNIKSKFQNNCISIFIMPPSLEELKNRLLNRGTEEDNSLEYRTQKFEEEMNYKDQFDFVIINDNFELACDETLNLITNFLNK